MNRETEVGGVLLASGERVPVKRSRFLRQIYTD